jgi:hypothetical protein
MEERGKSSGQESESNPVRMPDSGSKTLAGEGGVEMESTDYMTGKRRLEYYDTLRQMHSLLKDLLFAYDELDADDRNALDAVQAVLYLAEGVFATNKERRPEVSIVSTGTALAIMFGTFTLREFAYGHRKLAEQYKSKVEHELGLL